MAVKKKNTKKDCLIEGCPDICSTVLDTSPCMAVLLDAKGVILYANARAKKFLGFKKHGVKGISYDAPAWRIAAVDGGRFPSSKLPFSVVKKTKKPVKDIRHIIETNPGKRLIVSVSMAPLFDESGGFAGAAAFLTDISAQIKADEFMENKISKSREQAAISTIRAQMWKLVSAGGKDENEIIKILLDTVGPALGAERLVFNAIVNGRVRAVNEWRHKSAKIAVKGMASDPKYFLAIQQGGGQFILTVENMLDRLGPHLRGAGRPIFLAVVRMIGSNPSLFTPYIVDGKTEGYIICRGLNEPVTRWSEEKKAIIAEASQIISSIVSRRRAEVNKYESEEKYRSLFSNMENGTALHRAVRDLKGKIKDYEFVEVNQAWINDTGFHYKKEEMPCKSAKEVMPFLPPQAWKELNKVTDTGISWQNVVMWPPDRWLFIKAFRPMKDCLAIVCSNVTEIKKSEMAIKESETKYRGLFNNANDMVFVAMIGEDGSRRDIAEANGVACRVLKMTQKELTSKNMDDITAEESKKKLRDTAGELAAKGRAVYELMLSASDGRRIYAEFSSHVFYYAGKKAVLSIARDMTDRKLAEEAIRESEGKFRTLSEQSLIGIGIMQSGKFMYINDAFSSMVGYDRQRILSLESWEFAEMIHPDDRDFVSIQARKKMEGVPGAAQSYQFRLKTESGEYKWFEIYSKTINYMGAAADLFAVADISIIKQAQEKLENTIDELQRSNDELEKFAYVASHDLQEPLRMVSNYVQLLQRRYGGRLDSDADEFIGYAVEGAERMGRLIKDLLAYSRINTLKGDFVEIDLNSAVNAALLNLEGAMKEKNAQIRFENLPCVKGDEFQIVQLLQNLIGNAVKFTVPGLAPVVEISGQKIGSRAEICVKDNGIGIAPKYFDKIFAIFQRLHSKTEYEGTGIGLSICKKIVERHSGSIWVESEEGNGTRFYFTLELAEVKK